MNRSIVTTSLMTAAALTAASPVGAAKSWPFNSPFGVAVNSHDVVYVAEIKAKRVSKFTTDGKPLGVIDEIEGYGKLVGPFDVHIGPNDWVYITDCFAHKVLVLDADEKLKFALGTGTKGMEPGQFSQPHFITVSKSREIFVSDTFNARIQKFTPEGQFITAWGRIGDGPGEFLYNGYLSRVDVDNQGFVYVREFDGGRIQKYTEDGKYVATFAKRGTGEGELDEGYGLTVIDGKLYCPDTFESRVQVFSLEGKLLSVWDPGEGDGGGLFNSPVDIAQTSTGDLIMSNWKSERVTRLSKDGRSSWTGDGRSRICSHGSRHNGTNGRHASRSRQASTPASTTRRCASPRLPASTSSTRRSTISTATGGSPIRSPRPSRWGSRSILPSHAGPSAPVIPSEARSSRNIPSGVCGRRTPRSRSGPS